MRLLICTQAVDQNDSNLGFFHRWIEEFARHASRVTVICLRKGVHQLPKNVEVISLGERGKFFRALELHTLAWGRRKEYDAVFVHMNPEYVVATGWLWRFLHKKIGLWYVHKSVDAKLRAATKMVDIVFTASRESFRLAHPRIKIVGHGIDTDFFTPDESIRRGRHVLSAGRLSESKHHDLIIKAAKISSVPLRIAGEGTERAMLEQLARSEGVDVAFLGGLTQEELRDQYQSAAHFVHASTTGSMDKVVLEAAACDCSVITTTKDLYKSISVQSVEATPEAIANAIVHTARESVDRVSLVRDQHSLKGCIENILNAYGN